MKLIVKKILILCISFLLICTPSFAEDTFASLNWQYGPKFSQNILGKAVIFVSEGYQFLDSIETEKYLKLSHNAPSSINENLGNLFFSLT